MESSRSEPFLRQHANTLRSQSGQKESSPPTDESTPEVHERDRLEQRHLARKQALMLFGTAIFIALILATFATYERKGNFSSGQRRL